MPPRDAELEVKGEYSEARHDPVFDGFGDNGLQASDLALFPDYLVRLNVRDLSGPEQSTLIEILSVDLPVKILVQTDDVIEESPLGNGHLAFALRSRQLASMAMGLSGVFVLQSPASSLYQLRRPSSPPATTPPSRPGRSTTPRASPSSCAAPALP